MITTPDLIELLARGMTPVRRLRQPLVRGLGWLLLAAIVVTGPRPVCRGSPATS